eukprot:4951638-Alexandrium_andersonii.AAC.1
MIHPRVCNRLDVCRGYLAEQLRPPPDRLSANFEIDSQSDLGALNRQFGYCAASRKYAVHPDCP